MKAMILAAGEGRRMRPLTLTTPKPLLKINGKRLIEYHIDRLRGADITEIVINIAYLGDVIKQTLGNGHSLGVNIEYSEEPFPLETGGAIVKALPLLGEQPFILVNGDVWTDYSFSNLDKIAQRQTESNELAHLVLVDNPEHNSKGDFCINEGFLNPIVRECSAFTFSGVSVINPALVKIYPKKRQIFPLVEAFRWAMKNSAISAEYYKGVWVDVGTPERLQGLQTAP